MKWGKTFENYTQQARVSYMQPIIILHWLQYVLISLI